MRQLYSRGCVPRVHDCGTVNTLAPAQVNRSSIEETPKNRRSRDAGDKLIVHNVFGSPSSAIIREYKYCYLKIYIDS